MKYAKIILLTFLGWIVPGQAATTLTGQAFDTASIGLSSGVALSSGVVNMGFYSVAPTRSVLEAYTSATDFLNNFTSIISGPVGIDSYLSLFSVTKEVLTGDASFDAKQIYLIIGNGSTVSSSTQLGVFTDSGWITQANPSGPTPLAQSFEISVVSGLGILFGSYAAGGGEYPLDGVVNEYRLQAVIPEPNTFALVSVFGLAALFKRRGKV